MKTLDRRFLTGVMTVIAGLFLAVSLHADPDATPTPEPIVTAEALPPINVASTAEVITESTPQVPATLELTAETPVSTVETGATEAVPQETVITLPPPVTVVSGEVLPPEPPMSLLVRELLDNGDTTPWTLNAGWSFATTDTGLSLQALNTTTQAILLKGGYLNVAVQARVRTEAGAAQLHIRQSSEGAYMASLNASGQVDLYRGTVLLKSATVAPLNSQWTTLRLAAVDGVVRVAVNDAEVIAVTDLPGLVAGTVAFSAAYDPALVQNTLWVDDVFLWVKTTELANYPAPTPYTAPVIVTPAEFTPLPPVIIEVTPLPPVIVEATQEATDSAPILSEATTEPIITDEPIETTPAPPVATDEAPVITDEPTAEATVEATDEAIAEPNPDKSRVAVERMLPGADPIGNDMFASGAVANFIPYSDSRSTSLMTVEIQEPTPTCGFNITQTIWYSFTPTTTSKYLLTTAGSTFDTTLAVYVGSSLDSLTEVACNDDVSPINLTSSLTPTLTAGIPYRIQVGGYNGLAGTSVFTIKYASVSLLPAPTLFPGAAITNREKPLLQWGAVPGATLYEVEINTKSTFNGVKVFTGQSAANAQIPGSSLIPGLYYWRVRTFNVNLDPGNWSLPRTLTINVTPPNPALPAANAVLTSLRPIFSWTGYPGATQYELVIYDSTLTTVISSRVLGPVFKHTSDPLVQGVYQWRLRAKDASGNWGEFSAPRLFTLNIATGYKDADVTTDTTPIFTWIPVPGATGYRLEIYTDAALTTAAISPFPISNSGLSSSFVMPLIANGDSGFGVFYWRINANTGGFPTLGTNLFRKLTISPPPPITPKLSLTKPAANTNNNGPVIEWAATTSTVGGPFTYDLEISNSSGFATQIIKLTGLTGLSTDLPDNTLPVKGTYYARVRAVNKYGVAGLWSRALTATPIRAFAYNPTPPIPKSPLPNAVSSSLMPTFLWTTYPGASSYELRFSRNPSMTPAVVIPAIVGVSYTPLQPLDQGLHYWQVLAKDANGDPGPYSTPQMLTLDIATGPVNNLITDKTSTTFSWKPVPGAESYRLEMFTNAAMTTPVSVPPITISGGATSSYVLSPVTNGDGGNGVFYWRINVKMPLQIFPALPAAFSHKLTISPAAPGIPLFSNTKPAAHTSDSGPVIEWLAPAGSGAPFTYDLEVSTVNTFATTLIKLAGLTGLSTDLPTNTLTTPGLHYVRIRAVNKFGIAGLWTPLATPLKPSPTPLRSFQYNITPPKLVSPAEGEIVHSLKPTFTWEAYPGATEYLIRFGVMLPLTGNGQSVGTQTSYTPPSNALQALYYWQVRAKDANGNLGEFSAPRTVLIQLAKSPLNNAVIDDTTPTFTWEPVSGAQEYRLELYMSTGVGFTPHFVVLPASSPTSYTLPTPIGAGYGLYYWFINVKMPGENYSAGFTIDTMRILKISPSTPAAPEIKIPVAFVNSSGPTIEWAGPTITDTTIKYDIEISTSSTFTTLLASKANATGTSFTFSPGTLPAEGVYSVRVRSVNVYGVFSKWVSRPFTYDGTALSAPAPLAPANESVVTPLPVFSWTPVKGALRYELQLIADEMPHDPPASPVIAVPGATYTPPGALIATTYYWRVRSVDLANNPSSWSELRRLKVVSLPTAVPQLNRFVSTPILSWTPISWVLSDGYYRVEIDNEKTFINPEYRSPTIPPGTHSLEVPVISAMSDGTWYWRVSACPPTTAITLKCVWSVTGSFVVDR